MGFQRCSNRYLYPRKIRSEPKFQASVFFVKSRKLDLPIRGDFLKITTQLEPWVKLRLFTCKDSAPEGLRQRWKRKSS